MTFATSVASSIAPFDPTIGITAVASIMLTVFVAAMVFLALAPVVSAKWTEKLGADPQGDPTIQTNEAD